jgi:hypothetical protein
MFSTMSERTELLELYRKSNDLQMGVMPSEGDLQQMEEAIPEPLIKWTCHSWRVRVRVRPSQWQSQRKNVAKPGCGLDFKSKDKDEEFDDWGDHMTVQKRSN